MSVGEEGTHSQARMVGAHSFFSEPQGPEPFQKSKQSLPTQKQRAGAENFSIPETLVYGVHGAP